MAAYHWLGLLVLSLSFLAPTLAAEPAVEGKAPETRPPPPPRTTKEVRERLAQRVPRFSGIQDENTSFKEALDLLSACYGLKFEMHQAAFEAEVPPVRAVLNTRIVPPSIPSLADRSLYSILSVVVNRLPTTSGAAFSINGNAIVITTGEALARRGLRAEPPPDPRTAPRARELRQALAKPVRFTGFDKDETLTFADVLDRLSRQYGLTFEVNQTAFRAEVPPVPEVENTPMADKQGLPAINNVTLGAVLLMVLDRIPTPSGATYVLRHDCIEISTKQFVQAERTGVIRPAYGAPPPPLLP